MRILHVLSQLPKHTGSGIYFYNIINEFAKSGHEQSAVFACQDDFELDTLESHHHYSVEFKSEELPFPIVGMSDVMPYESTRYSQLDEDMINKCSSAFRKELVRARDTFKPDIVILHHLWILTSLATEIFSNSHKIGICHNTDLRQAVKNPHLKERYVTKIHELDIILALGDDQIKTISGLFDVAPENIIAIGAGYDENIFYPRKKDLKNSDSEIQIAYVGKFDKSKGVYSLLNAYAKIDGDPTLNTKLHIVASLEQEAKDEIKKLTKNSPSIELHDKMEPAALGDFFRSSDVFVMPSFYEGLGLISVEALACGVWTVASDIDALKDLLGHKVNNQNVIEYVKRPKLFNTDQPVEEDLPTFEAELEDKIRIQIKRVQNNTTFPGDVFEEISNNSWENICKKIEETASTFKF